jgi:hypothetical protein
MDQDDRAIPSLAVVAAALIWLLATLSTVLLRFPQLARYSGGLAPPETLFLASPAVVDGYLHALGEAGRSVYARTQWVGFGSALLMVFTALIIIRWLARKLPTDVTWTRWLLALPVTAGLFDAAENAFLLRALQQFPALSPSLLPWMTSVKLLLMVAMLLGIAGLAAIALRLQRLAPVNP